MKHPFRPADQDRLRQLCREGGTVSWPEVLRAGEIYLEHLLSFNRTVALISRAGNQAATAVELFLSSLSALKFLPRESGLTVIDLGSGGGFPAIPLKIARPDLRWILIESKERKCMFLESVVRVLELPAIKIVCRDFEKYTPPQNTHVRTIISRAGPPTAPILKWAANIDGLANIVFFKSSSEIEPTENIIRKHGPYLLERSRIDSDDNIEDIYLLVVKFNCN